MPPSLCDLDLLTLKMVSESRVTWATSTTILVFVGLSVLDLGSMYATDRQTDFRQHHRLMPPPGGGRGITNRTKKYTQTFCSINQEYTCIGYMYT